jgi:hypothetical protein
VKKILLPAFLTIASIMLSSQAICAQAANADAEYDKYIAILRSDVRSTKKQLIAANLPLPRGRVK